MMMPAQYMALVKKVSPELHELVKDKPEEGGVKFFVIFKWTEDHRDDILNKYTDMQRLDVFSMRTAALLQMWHLDKFGKTFWGKEGT